MDDCFICSKHQGREAGPPGGYIARDDAYRDEEAVELVTQLRETLT